MDRDSLKLELETLWRGHARVGLQGYMQLYTEREQDPWRSKESGLSFWFDQNNTEAAIDFIAEHYNNGKLPNSPLLLNPIVHRKDGENYTPLGSGVVWSTAFSLGVEKSDENQEERFRMLGVYFSPFHRGENARAGYKVLGFAEEKLSPLEQGRIVPGCLEIFELASTSGDAYYGYYLLSGISYLAKHGSFSHPDFKSLVGDMPPDEEAIKTRLIPAQRLKDAAYCWQKYDHHHSLFAKFGIDAGAVEQNLRFYQLCARDIQLFDATGPMRASATETFDFIVPGYIPRGSVTLIAASGGTGKSSVAHHLCVMASIDYAEGEPAPRWLGQPINTDLCKGICVYFSGEDGPAIINARSALFDPEGRSNRLMFQRTDFGEGVNFSQFMKRLERMPDVPIIVIDPARKYLMGDEEDSQVVSDFFEAIEEFAINKKAAMLVVHHLRKGANPTTTRQVLDELRGSQVFIDRPRVVLGMFREGQHTVVGLAKNNIPPNLGMVQEERLFVRNPKNLQLIWLPGPEGVRGVAPSADELEQLEIASMQNHDG